MANDRIEISLIMIFVHLPIINDCKKAHVIIATTIHSKQYSLRIGVVHAT